MVSGEAGPEGSWHKGPWGLGWGLGQARDLWEHCGDWDGGYYGDLGPGVGEGVLLGGWGRQRVCVVLWGGWVYDR